MSVLTRLPPSKKFEVRYQINGITFCLTNHALERALERKIDIEKRILSLKGLRVSQYREQGVICDYNKWQKHVIIITLLSKWMIERNKSNWSRYARQKSGLRNKR